MKFRTLTTAAAIVIAITGCGPVSEVAMESVALAQPEVIVHPGYKVIIDGEPTAIFGPDDCKVTGKAESEQGCIVLNGLRESVLVSFNTPKGLVKEEWRIVHGANTAHFQRPDGGHVASAQYSRKSPP